MFFSKKKKNVYLVTMVCSGEHPYLTREECFQSPNPERLWYYDGTRDVDIFVEATGFDDAQKQAFKTDVPIKWWSQYVKAIEIKREE